MAEAPRKLISAIRQAGISVDPSHPSFRHVAERVWSVIESEAAQIRELLGRREESTINTLIAGVRAVELGPRLKVADPDRIEDSILLFSSAVRSIASEMVAARNRTVGGHAEEPPESIAERRPIRRRGGRKWC